MLKWKDVLKDKIGKNFEDINGGKDSLNRNHPQSEETTYKMGGGALLLFEERTNNWNR